MLLLVVCSCSVANIVIPPSCFSISNGLLPFCFVFHIVSVGAVVDVDFDGVGCDGGDGGGHGGVDVDGVGRCVVVIISAFDW